MSIGAYGHRSPAAAAAWARTMLLPGAAVILDTETTDLYGAVCQIAVADTNGTVLLDTLVNPRCPIEASAQRIHQITPADLAGAPTFRRVLPDLLTATAGRRILAYNAAYDHRVLLAEAGRAGANIEHLADDGAWGCVMRARSESLGHPEHYLPLRGPHRAAGDVLATLEVLREIATAYPSPGRDPSPVLLAGAR